MYNPSRYVLIFADGASLLFDDQNCSQLHEEVRLPNGQLTVDENRPAIAWVYLPALAHLEISR
jgi:hypothetical protein